jgi:hypothetical protein
MKKLLLILCLIPILAIGQTNPPPPPAPTTSNNSSQDFGTTQNGIMGAQSRSFGGGSIIKPNQLLNSADLTFIGSNTYEADQPSFRPGTSLSWGKFNYGKGFGINALVTFDFTQQTYSLYYRNKDWYYHLNFGKMGLALNSGMSVTRVWSSKKVKDLSSGIQLGISIVANGDKSNKDAYFVLVPYTAFLIQKEFKITNKIQYKPEAFLTFCSPYYDLGANFTSSSTTFNAVVGNCIGLQLSKSFRLNLTYRGNINTTPKWGLMHNILIGSTLKF